MSEENEPDWLAELAKGGEERRRQIEQLVRVAEQFLTGARQDTTSSGPVPLFQQRLVRAVGAAMRELSPPHPVAHQQTASLTVTPVMTATATVTASGSIAMRPMRVSGQGKVENPPSGQAERSIGQILALVLVAIATWRLLVVPEQDWAAVDHRLTVIGFGLTIAVLIWNKQNKPK